MIPNEVMEGLARIRIAGEQRQVLDVILRKTYGFHKPSDEISLSQFCLATGLSKVSVSKAIKNLLVKNIITKKGNGGIPEYSCHEDFGSWEALPKKVTLPKKVKPFTKKGKEPLPKKRTTKESTDTKETITKESTSVKSKKSISQKGEEPKVRVIKSEAHKLILLFCQAHLEKTGEAYDPVWGRDTKILNDIIKNNGVDKTYEFLRRYFTVNDEFILNQGYAINYFKAQLPKLKSVKHNGQDSEWFGRWLEGEDENKG